jgi:hypothetical protein
VVEQQHPFIFNRIIHITTVSSRSRKKQEQEQRWEGSDQGDDDNQDEGDDGDRDQTDDEPA